MTKRTKPRRVKARAINRVDYGLVGSPMIPIWELPRTAAAYDAMVEQMVRVQMKREWPSIKNIWSEVSENTRSLWRDSAIAALRAIGIRRPKEDKP